MSETKERNARKRRAKNAQARRLAKQVDDSVLTEDGQLITTRPTGERRTARLHLVVTPSLHKIMVQTCARERRTKTQLVEIALERYLGIEPEVTE